MFFNLLNLIFNYSSNKEHNLLHLTQKIQHLWLCPGEMETFLKEIMKSRQLSQEKYGHCNGKVDWNI